MQNPVYDLKDDIDFEDTAWCDICHRDTAFCLCKCYVCEEQLEDCQCTCAQCETKVKGGGLCEIHKATWDQEVQGPQPGSNEELGTCTQCGTTFNKAFLFKAPHRPRFQPTTYLTNRTLCIKCDTKGKFEGDYR